VGYTQQFGNSRTVPTAGPYAGVTALRTKPSGAVVTPGSVPRWVIAASAVLHGVVIAGVVWHGHRLPPTPPSDEATVQVEYVHQDAQVKGAPNPDEAADPTDAPAKDVAPPAAAPPPPSNPYADVPMPKAAPPSDSAAGRAGHPTNADGSAPTDIDGLTVTGQNMVSSGPDAAYRNMPPNYPRDAVRAHQQGSVQVTIHITPEGVPDQVNIVISSGSPVLDKAVREAVWKWHFKPAIHDGVAVASIYRLQMNFRNQDAQ
jgi:protein TonB